MAQPPGDNSGDLGNTVFVEFIAPPMTTLCTQQFATPEHFERWESHAKTCDMYTLKYIIKDCQSAAVNMKGWNPIREGFYLDQAATYGMEITRRNRELPAGLRHRI